MHCEIKELSSVVKELSFVVPALQVDNYLVRAYQSVNQKVRLKGFRPGKAPKAMVEQFYGQEINQKALEKLMSEVLFDALDERQIKPIIKPRVSSDKPVTAGQDFAFTAHVEILPAVELKQWQDLEVKLPERPEVGEEAVLAELETLRTRMASFKMIEDRKVTQLGDYVDYSVVESCSHEGHDHDHDHDHKPQQRFIELTSQPEVEPTLVGAEIGQPIQVENKTYTITTIKQCIKPDLDDELAKDLSDKFETLADLKADMKIKLAGARITQIEEDKKHGVLDALIAANPIEVPEGLVLEQAQHMAANNLARFPKEMAMNFWKAYGTTMIENSKPAAERLIKANLLLDAVAADQDIPRDDENMANHFDSMTRLVLQRARLS